MEQGRKAKAQKLFARSMRKQDKGNKRWESFGGGKEEEVCRLCTGYFYPGAWCGACESRNRASLCSKDEVGKGRGRPEARQRDRRERKEGRDSYGPSSTSATGMKPPRLEIGCASEKKNKLLQNAVICLIKALLCEVPMSLCNYCFYLDDM